MAKILLCSEFSYLKSGYSKYYYELAKGFTEAGHEVVELAARGDASILDHVEYAEKSPWKIYLCDPNPSDKHHIELYNKRQSTHNDAIHGAWLYPFVLEREKPEFIISVRDYWYDSFIMENNVDANVILSPTVDSFPQKDKWVDYYNRADQLVFYNEWSQKWWETQTNRTGVTISPAVDSNFKALNRNKCRRMLGLDPNDKIAFTLMRNQLRKRIPELFEAIKQTDWKLHCHTFYPDGICWDIPALLLQYDVAEKVLFSYYCNACKSIDIKHYCGSSTHCKKCGDIITLPLPNRPIDEETLNVSYSSADYYIQYATSEGFGIPPIEAGAAGLASTTIFCTGQKGVAGNIDAKKMEPLGFQRDIFNNCFRAIPDNIQLVKILQKLDVNYDRNIIREKCLSHYSWDKTVKKWLQIIDSMPLKKPKNKDLRQPIKIEDLHDATNSEFVTLCMKYVANRPDLVGGFQCLEMLNNLNNTFKNQNKENVPYKREQAYNEFYALLLEQVNDKNQN